MIETYVGFNKPKEYEKTNNLFHSDIRNIHSL